ncbi:hypothetical protein SteCoe_36273 [Stentor coeruleus]|uniref:UV excision repair protein RAD23 n=1 Tax=Stentor coeruleus TaxID=5963 RepID=A0A1R2AQF5_9CILI|nr:hypothetical protein SteCoe_36273 [Stentor coeruleus]
MNLKVKNVKGGEKQLLLPEDASVHTLKTVIHTELGVHSQNQKLLFKGRILDDSKLLSEYSIKSNDTIFLMVSQSQVSQPEPVLINPQPVSIPPPPAPEPSNSEQLEPRLSHNTPNAYEDHKTSGHPRPRITEKFNFLIENPDFQTILQTIRNDPRTFESFIIQLEQQNPELYNLIIKNKKEFIEIVRGRETESDQVQLSKEEFKQVKELMELGFSAQDCLEAYLSCVKNKELAANYLFNNR